MPAGTISSTVCLCEFPSQASHLLPHSLASFDMQVFNASTLVVLLHFSAIFCSAMTIPADIGSPLDTRSRPVCANAPNTIAGTFVKPSCPNAMTDKLTSKLSTLNGRSLLANLGPRHSTQTVLWCAHGSQTYIILSIYDAIAGDAVRNLLAEAIANVINNIDFNHDGLIPGVFNWLGDGNLRLHVWNTNNHQTSWSVLRAALSALEDYMSHNMYGIASFTINDGAHEVGEGMIGSIGRNFVRNSIWTWS